jgi:uncharacterized protein (DUF1778 family)
VKKGKETRTTVTVRLTRQEHAIIQRLCRLKNTTQTSYLATLAAEQAKDELLNYAVEEFQKETASISELVRKTGLDVTTIMDAIADVTARDRRPIESFLAAAQTISRELKDDDFYKMALKAAENA